MFRWRFPLRIVRDRDLRALAGSITGMVETVPKVIARLDAQEAIIAAQHRSLEELHRLLAFQESAAAARGLEIEALRRRAARGETRALLGPAAIGGPQAPASARGPGLALMDICGGRAGG